MKYCMLQSSWNLPWTLTSGYLATSPMISVDWRFTISAVTNGFSVCIARMSGKGQKKFQGKCFLCLWKSMHKGNILDSKMNIFFQLKWVGYLHKQVHPLASGGGVGEGLSWVGRFPASWPGCRCQALPVSTWRNTWTLHHCRILSHWRFLPGTAR